MAQSRGRANRENPERQSRGPGEGQGRQTGSRRGGLGSDAQTRLPLRHGGQRDRAFQPTPERGEPGAIQTGDRSAIQFRGPGERNEMAAVVQRGFPPGYTGGSRLAAREWTTSARP